LAKEAKREEEIAKLEGVNHPRRKTALGAERSGGDSDDLRDEPQTVGGERTWNLG